MSATSLDEIVRRTIDLNLRYYTSFGKITADYLRDILGVVSSAGNLKTPFPFSQAQSSHPRASDAPATSPPTPASIVLEAEGGQAAVGVFLVDNNLNQDVEGAAIVATNLMHPSGGSVPSAFTFDPPQITLGPREQILVRVGTMIPESLEPEVRYVGEITISELKGTRVPFVVRRRQTPST